VGVRAVWSVLLSASRAEAGREPQGTSGHTVPVSCRGFASCQRCTALWFGIGGCACGHVQNRRRPLTPGPWGRPRGTRSVTGIIRRAALRRARYETGDRYSDPPTATPPSKAGACRYATPETPGVTSLGCSQCKHSQGQTALNNRGSGFNRGQSRETVDVLR